MDAAALADHSTKFIATPNSLRLFKSTARHAFALAAESAGINIAARIAMMAITTSNSIKVNARLMEPCLGKDGKAVFADKKF